MKKLIELLELSIETYIKINKFIYIFTGILY